MARSVPELQPSALGEVEGSLLHTSLSQGLICGAYAETPATPMIRPDTELDLRALSSMPCDTCRILRKSRPEVPLAYEGIVYKRGAS